MIDNESAEPDCTEAEIDGGQGTGDSRGISRHGREIDKEVAAGDLLSERS